MGSELVMLALNTHTPSHACCWQASSTPAPWPSMKVPGRLSRTCGETGVMSALWTMHTLWLAAGVKTPIALLLSTAPLGSPTLQE